MNLYVYLDLAILIPPLLLSFDKKVGFYKKWPQLAGSIVIVSTVYLVWDILVTARGHWEFSERYAGNDVLFGLPLGEILFFITVPYACLFIYEVARAYFKGKTILSERTSVLVSGAATVLFTVLGIVFAGRGYTMLAFFSVALFFLLVLIFDRRMLCDRHTWLYFALSYFAFIVANSVLTGLPVVIYGEAANMGIRVFTIPLEDFFYNFGLLGFYLLAYRLLWRRTRED